MGGTWGWGWGTVRRRRRIPVPHTQGGALSSRRLDYTRLLLEREFSIDEEKVREYFPLSHVIAEMLGIFESVLGLRFKQVTGAWERKLVWHEDAQLWEVWNSESNGGGKP